MSNSYLITHLESVDSTNNYATTLVNEKKAVDRQVVVAQFQTNGKGHSNNCWSSEKGKNLMISVILFPNYLKSIHQFKLSICISLAVCDFLSQFLKNIKIKWPNDIYVNDKKICGILIENSMMGNYFYHAVAGIGININQQEFDSILPNPTSVLLESNKQFDLDQMLHIFLSHLTARLTDLENQEFDKLTDNYISQLYRFNTESEFLENGNRFRALIVGIGEIGQLILKENNGHIRNFLFKEIEYII